MLTFSDLQAEIVAELIRNNIAVHAFNQRDIGGILDMIRTLGALVGASGRAEALASSLANMSMLRAQRSLGMSRASAHLFRGMGRADDFRHRLGLGAD